MYDAQQSTQGIEEAEIFRDGAAVLAVRYEDDVAFLQALIAGHVALLHHALQVEAVGDRLPRGVLADERHLCEIRLARRAARRRDRIEQAVRRLERIRFRP